MSLLQQLKCGSILDEKGPGGMWLFETSLVNFKRGPEDISFCSPFPENDINESLNWYLSR